MADLVIRPGLDDIALMERVLAGLPASRPQRVVVDAHAAGRMTRVAAASRRAGISYLVDPQTYYLQDRQHAGDPWANLHFDVGAGCTAAGLLKGAGRLDVLVANAVDHQLENGATVVVAPYVHIEQADEWLEVQVRLWRATRDYLQREVIGVDVLAVVALGWRQLDRAKWPATLLPLITELRSTLAPAEVALAASKIGQGVDPTARLASLVAVVRRLRREWPVLVWQQGLLGEAAVAGGAAGYECGIGRREHCDLPAHMRTRRRPRDSDVGYLSRGVYSAALRRSLPKQSIERLIAHEPRIAAQLTCLDPRCCPNGQVALMGDSRAHTVAARRRGLDLVTEPAHAAWKWNYLAREASVALGLAEQVNVASRRLIIPHVDTGALTATWLYAENRRQRLGHRRVA